MPICRTRMLFQFKCTKYRLRKNVYTCFLFIYLKIIFKLKNNHNKFKQINLNQCNKNNTLFDLNKKNVVQMKLLVLSIVCLLSNITECIRSINNFNKQNKYLTLFL